MEQKAVNGQTDEDPILRELKHLDPTLIPLLDQADAGARLMEVLPKKYNPVQAQGGAGLKAWDYAGILLQNRGRLHEALTVHWGHYLHLLGGQSGSSVLHKGTPLVRISDCFGAIGFPVHSKRYLMLTLCEDALHGNGSISPQNTGVYFRLIWGGLTERELHRYAEQFFKHAQDKPDEALFPEALLQGVDDDWATEFPSVKEASFYRANALYIRHLIAKLGDGSGGTLELLAQYLMSCMAGCRARRRLRSWSTDYDVVCAMEGFDVDFRSELGRHFVCECKDWKTPADFSVMAKFCRVLDSTKSRFGILFSREGISGEGKKRDADLEQLKIFQDRGIIIVVLSYEDLEKIAEGTNLIALLRSQYEEVRLDLRVRT